MMQNSLRTRGVSFALLFGPSRILQREEAMKFHGAVCDKLGHDDISFQYHKPDLDQRPSADRFEIRLQRKEGRGGYTIVVDNSGIQKPIRLLISYDWPPSPQHVAEVFDQVCDVTFKELEGNWQRVLAEVRLRAQCSVSEKDAVGYVTKRLLGLKAEAIERLGQPLVFGSVKLEIASAGFAGDSLENPKREILLEVLREDPSNLYLEVMSQWSQFPDPTQIDLRSVRPIDREPREYVEEARDFLQKHVLALGT